jgi:hypothetical protein
MGLVPGDRSLERGDQRADSEPYARPKSDAEYDVADQDPVAWTTVWRVDGPLLIIVVIVGPQRRQVVDEC